MKKKGNQIVWYFIILIFVFYMLFLQPYHSWSQKVKIKTENGITVVYNPKRPVKFPGVPSIVTLREDLVIGKNQKKEDYWFFMLTSLDVDEFGNIYTLDPKAIKIRIFDKSGKLIKAFGRKGQGPGEFQGPAWLKIMPENILVVYDVLNHRFTYMTLDGKILKTVNAAKLPRGRLIIDAKGYIYLNKIGRWPGGVDELVKIDPSLNVIIKFNSFEKAMEPHTINPFSIGYYFALSKENNLIWLLSSTYDIHIVDPDGKTLKRIIKDYTPVKISEEDKAKYLQEEISHASGLRSYIKFPKYYPIASGLFIDEQNRIYVRTFEKNDQSDLYYDIFNAEGRYISRFSLNEKEKVFVVKNSRIYCIIKENEEGIPLIKRYKMEWK